MAGRELNWDKLSSEAQNELVHQTFFANCPDASGIIANYTREIGAAWRIVERFPYYEIMKYPPGTGSYVSLFKDGIWFKAEGASPPEPSVRLPYNRMVFFQVDP
ncbi:hypothetical protein [Ferroacidibacillus organovorans]|uniref:Uncharacterized protein n=1 Tax=Ferroacidibacillus organovorans TaxID=1765683 RepID=A0A1V4EWB8_9BACL|nr:hypothetical protein [Ferroacidibacillus organovorans]OPG16958.1 hypothetical protein B2M26_03885 [Ferroacidibacillus organovorans]